MYQIILEQDVENNKTSVYIKINFIRLLTINTAIKPFVVPTTLLSCFINLAKLTSLDKKKNLEKRFSNYMLKIVFIKYIRRMVLLNEQI